MNDHRRWYGSMKAGIALWMRPWKKLWHLWCWVARRWVDVEALASCLRNLILTPEFESVGMESQSRPV